MIVECPGCTSRYDVTGRPPGTVARCRCGATFTLPEPTQTAGQLSCPGCGANVPSCSHVCQFCSAALKIKACPRCFAKIFHESKHCNQCGAKVARPAEATDDGEARIRSCPRCDGDKLQARMVGEVLIDECQSCHGAFLDVCAVEHIVRERRQASAAAIIGMVESTPRWDVPPATSGRMYLKCPDCDQVMNRVNFGRRSGVLVDVCKPHGTWFDAGELPKVVEYVMKGGLEAGERAEIEQMRERAKRQESRSSGSMDIATVSGQHGLLGRRTGAASRVGAGFLAGLIGSLFR